MRGLPFLTFYASDWLGSSARLDMTLAERAIYLDLLFQIWERGGGLPTDEAKLAKMAMATADEFAAAWPAIKKHFVNDPDQPGMLTNLRMLDVITRQRGVHDARSKAGRKGAASRWPDGKTDGKAIANGWQGEGEREREREVDGERKTDICAPQDDARVCSPPSSKKHRSPCSEVTAEQQAWFEAFWEAYWLKKDRARSLSEFFQHVKTEEQLSRVILAVQQQRPAMMNKPVQFRPYAASWLSRRGYEDPDPTTDSIAISDEDWNRS